MSIVVEGMISKLQSAPDYTEWLDTVTANVVDDIESNSLCAYVLRLLSRDKAQEVLEEVREQSENLLRVIAVLSGQHDSDLFEQIRSHGELDEYVESLHRDLPDGSEPVAQFYAVRLLSSEDDLLQIRKSFDDLSDTPHLQAACLSMLDGTETQTDIDAILAQEHPEDVAEQEARDAAEPDDAALDSTDLGALRELQSKLSAQGRRSSSQETLLVAVGKVLDAHG